MLAMTELPYSARTRHVYIAGKPGYGKSTIEYWMALQDIAKGHAVAVLDPTGDLVDQLLNHIPKHRVDDCIYLDGLAPIPLDFMGWEDDCSVLADDLLIMFRRLCTESDWGVRMDAITNFAILAILEARRPFLDIYKLITNERFRNTAILPAIRHKEVLAAFWRKDGEFDHMPRDAASPVTTRMAKFVLNPNLSTVLGHPAPLLKIPKVVEDNKILLVNLAKIGEKAGNVYGSLIVSQLQQFIFRRKDRTHPLYMYVDEFQNFSTSAFGKILSEARKFNLGLTLANQHPKQIPDLIDDVKGCVSSFILFQMDAGHARELASAIRPYKPEELERLARFRALYRPAEGDPKFITIPKPPDPPTKEQLERAAYIRKRTVDTYSCRPPDEPLDLGQQNGDPDPPQPPSPQGRPRNVPPHRRPK
jgi:hypothetical protein